MAGRETEEDFGEAQLRSMLSYFPFEMQMDMAHTVMLAEQKIITKKEASDILRVLKEIQEIGPEKFQLDPKKSTLFWNVEAFLIKRLGEQLGGKMHTGRSHNDIQPTLSRLTARSRVIKLIEPLTNLQDALLKVAQKHVHTVMPGYTSLQHAQPWTFGHYLLRWFYAFERDFRRLKSAYETTNLSPLGASAHAGSSWPLNRNRTAELMGFDGIMINSIDACSGSKDYVAEILASCSIMMSNVGLLCGDLFVWSSYEFGMVELADGYCGTSSIMPQKKNPWAVDWARGAAGNAVGYLANCLGAIKGTGSTDAALQDFPEVPLADALDTATDFLDLLTDVVQTIKVNEEVMLQRAGANWTTASNLADTIVRQAGLSFRTAHGIVGRLVRNTLHEGRLPDSVKGTDVDRAAKEIMGRAIGLTDEVVRASLDPKEFIRTRVTIGSVNPDEVKRMLQDGLDRLQVEKRWLEEQKRKLAEANEKLAKEVATYTG